MLQVFEFKERLETYLRARFPGREGLAVTDLQRLTGGASNLSYCFTATWCESQRSVYENLVVRVQPEMGPVPPYDIRPQYEVLNRLQNTGIPIPRVYWLEMDSSVLGNPFFVMEKIEGESLLAVYQGLAKEAQDQVNREYVDYLVRIHGADWHGLGLSILGVPEHPRQYAEREIARWEWVTRNNAYGPQPIMAEALTHLKNNIPCSERTALCHGDYYVHNFFYRDGHIVAIFDWELAGLGDPISDIAWSAMFIDVLPGFWNEADFVKAYEDAAGVKLDEGRYFFWKLLAYVRLASAEWGAFRTGIESKDFEVHNLGIHSMLLPRLYNGMATMLGF